MTILRAVPALSRQIGLGLTIFVSITAIALPLAFISERLALGAAVAVGSVLAALLARRLHVGLLIAVFLAILGAFGATHAVILDRAAPIDAQRLAGMSPAAGPARGSPPEMAPPPDGGSIRPTTLVLPTRLSAGDGRHLSLEAPSGWAFPALLFGLWMASYLAVAGSRTLARWVWRRLEVLA